MVRHPVDAARPQLRPGRVRRARQVAALAPAAARATASPTERAAGIGDEHACAEGSTARLGTSSRDVPMRQHLGGAPAVQRRPGSVEPAPDPDLVVGAEQIAHGERQPVDTGRDVVGRFAAPGDSDAGSRARCPRSRDRVGVQGLVSAPVPSWQRRRSKAFGEPVDQRRDAGQRQRVGTARWLHPARCQPSQRRSRSDAPAAGRVEVAPAPGPGPWRARRAAGRGRTPPRSSPVAVPCGSIWSEP